MWSYKDHGKSYEAVYERQHPPGFRWLHESIGTNWRMLEMQADHHRLPRRDRSGLRDQLGLQGLHLRPCGKNEKASEKGHEKLHHAHSTASEW
jgi:hypothetical protein